MTVMPADRLNLPTKGRIAPGADADLTVFDPARVTDRATFEKPAQYSEGIAYVLVNGTLVVNRGALVDQAGPAAPCGVSSPRHYEFVTAASSPPRRFHVAAPAGHSLSARAHLGLHGYPLDELLPNIRTRLAMGVAGRGCRSHGFTSHTAGDGTRCSSVARLRFWRTCKPSTSASSPTKCSRCTGGIIAAT